MNFQCNFSIFIFYKTFFSDFLYSNDVSLPESAKNGLILLLLLVYGTFYCGVEACVFRLLRRYFKKLI